MLKEPRRSEDAKEDAKEIQKAIVEFLLPASRLLFAPSLLARLFLSRLWLCRNCRVVRAVYDAGP